MSSSHSFSFSRPLGRALSGAEPLGICLSCPHGWLCAPRQVPSPPVISNDDRTERAARCVARIRGEPWERLRGTLKARAGVQAHTLCCDDPPGLASASQPSDSRPPQGLRLSRSLTSARGHWRLWLVCWSLGIWDHPCPQGDLMSPIHQVWGVIVLTGLAAFVHAGHRPMPAPVWSWASQ